MMRSFIHGDLSLESSIMHILVATLFGVLGSRLNQAKDSYDEAHKRLATGQGNVIRQAEMLRELGVKATKKLPKPLVDETSGELSAAEELALIIGNDMPAETTSESVSLDTSRDGVATTVS